MFERIAQYISQADAASSPLQWMLFLWQKYAGMFLEGTLVTLYVSISGTLGGFVLGLCIGLIQDAGNGSKEGIFGRALLGAGQFAVKIYVELFRGTPMIVQGMVIYYGLRQANIAISPLMAGIVVTVLNTGAYMAETVRSGIGSISTGQREGALAMGLSATRTMLHVILPQAVKNTLPEMGNMFLTNLKMTSVLNVIGVSELFYMAKTAGGSYYKYFEAYLVIALIYLVLCFVVSRMLAWLERKLAGKSDYTLAAEYM